MATYQGLDIFVFGGIPGEDVVAEVLQIRRKYVAARVIEVVRPAESRVEPPCRYYGECTGCQWQHVDYDAQLAAKLDQVIDALKRIGGCYDTIVLPVLPSPDHYGYRNHARFTVGKGGDLGFVNREPRRIIHVDTCMLMHSGINHLLSELQDKCGETTQLAIRAGEVTGDYLVQPTMKSLGVTLATGQKHYQDSIDGRAFRVASPSFFQVNNKQTAELIQLVRQGLDLRGDEVLLDAYTGVGTIAVLISPYVKKVLAVEESTAAVADARENAQGLDNLEFLLGKTEDVLQELTEKPDVVVLDPPRAGCQPRALNSLLELAPSKIVYVSCAPETLARDLKILCSGNYSVQQIQPLDMFPQTHHVECVAILNRIESNDSIVLASGSPRRRELLTDLGLEFQIIPSDVLEEVMSGESAQDLVRRLSQEKARSVADRMDGGYIVAGDSVVVLNGRVLGKPVDADDAREMLRQLWGTEHQVTTGVTVINVGSGRQLTESMTSEVAMREFADADMERSVSSGYPMDKAGAYAIQDHDFNPARLTAGCYTNVLGLPVCRLIEMLRELGCVLPEIPSLSACGECQAECPLAVEVS